MQIIRALVEDHRVLTDLTLDSKAYWGYSADQIEAWKKELTICPDYIKKHRVFKGIVDQTIAGYYSYFPEEEGHVKLDNLFLWPRFIGKGYGKRLMADFISRSQREGARTFRLDAEPGAQAFYEKFGFGVIGRLKTSIPGRFLPIMELTLESNLNE